ncbi:MAG: apolipoprotein N-acyltransferase [Bifidobacteriaceae bacterium]|jgi:apolipoprotein N-acyltransferase|nr:apolipoprotein N-acyltransferase [Bifidobacteriaceae bacterium]
MSFTINNLKNLHVIQVHNPSLEFNYQVEDDLTSGRISRKNRINHLGLKVVLVVFSGLSFGISFESECGFPLALFALVTLISLVYRATVFQAWVFMLAFHLIAYAWAWNFLAIASDWLPYGLLVILESLIMSFAGLVYKILPNNFLTFPTVYVAFEYLRCVVPYGGFAFGRVAWSVSYSAFGFFGGLLGPIFVSWIILVFAQLFWPLSWLKILSMIIIVASAMALWGNKIYLSNNDIEKDQSFVRVAVIQGNIKAMKFGAEVDMHEVFTNHLSATKKLLGSSMNSNVDLIIWPENALEYDLWNPQNQEIVNQLANLSQEYHAPLLVGSQVFYADHRYNRYALIDASGLTEVYYDKLTPVPFGEYIPNRAFFRLFSPLVDQVTLDMWPGERPGILEVPLNSGRGIQLGILICFEITQDWLVEDIVNRGAQAIISPTNNVFFGHSSLAFQQFTIARFRAIQTNRDLIQASTMGISAGVKPDGEVFNQTDLYVSTGFIYDLALN